MRKFIYVITAFFISVGVADAAVRDANSPQRSDKKNTISRQTTTSTNTARTTTNRVISRTHPPKQQSIRKNTSSGQLRTTQTRSATQQHAARSTTNTSNTNTRNAATRTRTNNIPARATVTINTIQSNTFGTGYNTCRDAYFSCMDQFCATANDTYRRCICSSKLSEIQARERALAQTSDQLSDFKNLTLNVIDKTAAEVNAMLSASTGEAAQSIAKDKSASASKLDGIKDVLTKTKNKSLSTAGTLDIAGDINAIWSTTDLASGTNISNLTGEALYNAVHTQCMNIVSSKCESETTQSMVTSAYGMYIENDCSLLINALDKKLTNANSTIRATEREVNNARLENYNTHNSTAINDCIAQVRIDITSNTACGPNYVHCLDITGRYLNYETGEPIYSPEFYQLGHQISLSGDVLNNQTNRLLVQLLNNKRVFAARSLDTCRDIADEVWDEFMRQAISEIYQGQQERIRNVKNECLTVVNECYDEQTQQLKDFSKIDKESLYGANLELAEQMCQEKLNTCSNLYGGGTKGMTELLTVMHNITTQSIGQQCRVLLQDFAKSQCAVPGNDAKHAYPYGCRFLAPGEQKYAKKFACNLSTSTEKYQEITLGNQKLSNDYKDYTLSAGDYTYISCANNYELVNTTTPGIQACAVASTNTTDCGTDYIGSLYHKLVRYAMQNCVRPSESSSTIPETVLQDVSIVMTDIRDSMSTELGQECETLGGIWIPNSWLDNEETPVSEGKCTIQPDSSTSCVNNIYITDGIHDITGHTLYEYFYKETSSNPVWGYCISPEQASEDIYTVTLYNNNAQNCDVSEQSTQFQIKYGDPMPTITPPTCTKTDANNTSYTCEFGGYHSLDSTQHYAPDGTPAKKYYDTKGNTTFYAIWTNCATTPPQN